MTELKTLKDLLTEHDDMPCYIVTDEELILTAMKWIKANQTGKGVCRDIIPEDMRGSLAKDNWNNPTFTLGVEYGAIAMLMHFFNIDCKDITEEDLK